VEYFSKNAPFDDLDFEYASDVSYAGAVSPSVLIVAMIYIERMRITNKDYFESSDPADLFTTALLCASKFLYDEAEAEFVYNDEWARSCSRTLNHINKNEVQFLNALEWNTMAKEKEFYQMFRNFETVIAQRECERRGFASYSDMAILISGMTEIWNDVFLPALAVIGLATLTYTATVIGLYTCSLYSSTIDLPRVPSSFHFSPFSSVSIASTQLPAAGLDMIIEPKIATNRVKDAEEVEHKETKRPNTDLLSNRLSRLLLKMDLNNDSFCGKEMRKEEVLPMTPWTTWFYNTKAFAMWSV
jgi:hypothetical protein